MEGDDDGGGVTFAWGEHLNWVLENPGLSISVITSQSSSAEICRHRVEHVLQGTGDLVPRHSYTSGAEE